MKTHGFTLIELLVVVGIIAFLLAISVPMYVSSKQHTQTLVCQDHVRKIGIEFNLYYETHGSFPSAFVQQPNLPDSLRSIGDPTLDWRGLWWFYYLDLVPRTYSTQNDIVRCPAKKRAELKFGYNDLWGNYGVNWSVCKSPAPPMIGVPPEFFGTPENPASIKRPSATLLLADSGYTVLAWVHTLPNSHPISPKASNDPYGWAYVPGASVNAQKEFHWPELKEDAMIGRHPDKGVNGLFTDGHAAKMKADELSVQPKSHGQFENLTPLWKPL